MGWKNFKERFNIRHNIEMSENGLEIGSAYISDLATVDLDTGRVSQREYSERFLEKYYPELLAASPEEILALIRSEDTFAASIPIYTYEGADIIEKYCEVPEWPNVTHDGCMLYENTFSTDKAKVVRWAKRSTKYRIESLEESIVATEAKLAELKAGLQECQSDLNRLETEYPET